MYHEVHLGEGLAGDEELGEGLLVAGDAWVVVGTDLVFEGVEDGGLDYLLGDYLLHVYQLAIIIGNIYLLLG